MRLAIFDPATGRIQSVMQFSEASVADALLNIPDGYLAVEVAEDVTPATHYVGAEDQPMAFPPRPSDHAVWDGQEWIDPRTADDHEAEQLARRVAASLTKSEFLQACMATGILTPQEANIAARGDIPEPFLSAVASMTPEQRDMVSVIWPSATRINRMDPLILAVAAGAGIGDATLDALFGLAPYSV